MHKRLNYLLCCIFLLNYSTALTKVKPNVKAQQVLDQIKIPTSLQADFTYTTAIENAKEIQETHGQVWIKENKYHLIINEQIIISNGQTIWSYLPALHEVQINNYEAEAEFSPIQLLHMYQKGYTPVSLEQTKINKTTYELVDLVATDKKAFITHLKLMVVKKKHEIKHIKALDNNGAIHSFMITSFAKDIDIEDSYFEFDAAKHEDLEIVDLR